MKYVEKKGLNLSVFSLGTVQLGMDYGLGEDIAKPKKETAFEVLDCAIKNGVNSLDTANNYGDSEKVIGEWLKNVDESQKPLVITKIGPFDHSSAEILRKDILKQTEKCLETLGVSYIDILMVHNFEDYEKNPTVIKETFNELKEKNIIGYTALSAYSHNNYFDIATSGFDAVQIPLNVFDWTQIDNGGIKAIADSGMMIFVRSVFLQGLVFLKPDQVEQRIEFCKPYLEKYLQLCEEFNMEPAILALSYVLSVPGVTTVVLGTQTPQQVEDNCRMISDARKLTNEQLEKLHDAFADIDRRVIDPREWNKKQ